MAQALHRLHERRLQNRNRRLHLQRHGAARNQVRGTQRLLRRQKDGRRDQSREGPVLLRLRVPQRRQREIPSRAVQQGQRQRRRLRGPLLRRGQKESEVRQMVRLRHKNHLRA